MVRKQTVAYANSERTRKNSDKQRPGTGIQAMAYRNRRAVKAIHRPIWAFHPAKRYLSKFIVLYLHTENQRKG